MLSLALAERNMNYPSCPWVCSHNGKVITNFRLAWRKAVKEIGMPDLIFHDLRRSGLSNLTKAGVGQITAMRISGHKTDSVFRRYHIINEDDLKDASKKLEIFYHKSDTVASTQQVVELNRN